MPLTDLSQLDQENSISSTLSSLESSEPTELLQLMSQQSPTSWKARELQFATNAVALIHNLHSFSTSYQRSTIHGLMDSLLASRLMVSREETSLSKLATPTDSKTWEDVLILSSSPQVTRELVHHQWLQESYFPMAINSELAVDKPSSSLQMPACRTPSCITNARTI